MGWLNLPLQIGTGIVFGAVLERILALVVRSVG
jgi:hypothetical protein